MTTSQKKILVFLVLTFAFSSVFYFLGTTSEFPKSSLLFSWCPGAAALITQALFHRSPRELGWQPARARYLLLGYALPPVMGLAVYGLAWLTGLAGFDPFRQIEFTARELVIGPHAPILLLVLEILSMATVGVLVSLLWALGEELGWRGLLVLELARRGSFTKTALISGAVWMAWRMPEVLFFNYSTAGSDIPYVAACFAVYSMALSFVYTWLRLKTGSLWAVALLNASLGVFLSQFFALTSPVQATVYVVNRYGGGGLALAAIIAAYVCWRKRNELPGPGADGAAGRALQAEEASAALP